MQLRCIIKSSARKCITYLGMITVCMFSSMPVQAIEAGQYYYFISDKCVAKGPQTPEARGAATPDIMLFEVIPAGISDYFVNMNTKALIHYAEEGQAFLSSLEQEQAYTAGKGDINTQLSHAKDGSIIHHDFMLQRESIDFNTFVATLNGFSQLQTDKGRYFKKIVSLGNAKPAYKAVTRVRLTDNGMDKRMLLSDYSTSFYPLNEEGVAEETAFITVDHNSAMRASIHEKSNPYAVYAKHYVCGEKWEPGN
ncbi:hypothetical protein MTsDn1_06770 [Alteromonas sp. MTD1]